jgi:hypothetical protein
MPPSSASRCRPAPGAWSTWMSCRAADLALLRLKAPYEPRPGGFEAMFHAGSLEFPAEERDHHAAICSAVPTIVDVYLDRPAVLTDLAGQAAALRAATVAATRPSSTSSSEPPHRRAHFPSTCPDPWPLWRQAAPTSRSTPWTRSSDSVTDCAATSQHRAVRRLNALRFHGE